MTTKRKSAKKASKKARPNIVRRSTAGQSRAMKTPASEFVRTVPLHYPKPSIAVGDLVAADFAAPGTDLFDGKAHVAPADALLTYRGGQLIQNVQVFAIFWGTQWADSLSADPRWSTPPSIGARRCRRHCQGRSR